jgi:hypothetical protein
MKRQSSQLTCLDRYHLFFTNADEGIAEALRRDAELEANPSSGLSLEQVDQQIERRRP